MRWQDFADAAPELATLGRQAFEEQHLCLIGTNRADGWPRVSPNEVYIVDGELLLGMMPGSRKAIDLRRDPRITIVNGQTERIPPRGDSKLYGHAHEIADPTLRERFADTQEAAIGWRPTGDFPLFAVDILRAAYISFGQGRRLLRWSVERGTEELPHPDDLPPAGEPVSPGA
jgi:hypothetical protein